MKQLPGFLLWIFQGKEAPNATTSTGFGAYRDRPIDPEAWYVAGYAIKRPGVHDTEAPLAVCGGPYDRESWAEREAEAMTFTGGT